MPLLPSSYRGKFWYPGGHAETIIPSLFRKVPDPGYVRERLELPDGDFLDLDWKRHPADSKVKGVAIISHGLEGNSARHYVAGMTNYLFAHGWDICAWNYRSCSGEMNRTLRLYHHADTEDLHHVVQQVNTKRYSTVVLVGFSLGGSTTLNFLGTHLPIDTLRAAVVFSVPLDLQGSAQRLDAPAMAFYRNRFLEKLKRKILAKERQFPGQLDVTRLESIRRFAEFDEQFTAPLHGFANAWEFYQKGSALQHLTKIPIPVLVVNAQNDPMLSPECFPARLAQDSPTLYLEFPRRGGHTGFPYTDVNWMEWRTLEFLNQLPERNASR